MRSVSLSKIETVLSICPYVKNQLKNNSDTVSYAEKALNADNEYTESPEEAAYREAALHCKTTREMARYLNTSQPTVVRKLKKYNIKLK